MRSFVLDVPFFAKDDAKKFKCWWDNDKKYWEYKNNGLYEADKEVKKFVDTYTRVNLVASFDDKEEIKTNGGRWNADAKVWYTYKGNEALQKFMKFSEKSDTEKEKILNEKKEKEKEYKKIKKDFLVNGGKEEDFESWYSVNILNHE